MRLIDADYLGRYLFSRFHFQRVELEDVIAAMADFADKNTIEAEPVRHGRWVLNEDGKWACSDCECVAVERPDKPDVWQALTVCCPNCGVKMDGGAE